MKHKLLKQGLIFTLLLALIFSSTIFAFAAETNTWEIVQKVENSDDKVGLVYGSAVINGKIYTFTQNIYELDPATGRLILKQKNLSEDCHAAVVYNGKAYLLYSTGNVIVYDPSTNTYSEKAKMQEPRAFFQAKIIGDKIYALGGSGYKGPASTVEEYDISADKWTQKSPMKTTRSDFETQVINNKIYAIGGETAGLACTNTVEEYDPSTDIWTPKAPMATPRGDFSSQVVNNKIYVMGGLTSANNPKDTDTVEEYDPATNQWFTKKPMEDKRAYCKSVVVNNKIYAISGLLYNVNMYYLTSVEEYDPNNDTWERTASLNEGRAHFAAYTLNNTVYVMGGSGVAIRASSIEAYAPGVANAPTLTVTASPNKLKRNQKFTTEIAVHNGTNLCAEDIQIKYDADLFQYEGAQAETGMKIYKEDKSTPGVLRFIVASEGKDNAATGDKNLFHLTFTAKKAGTGKVDITKGRIADNATLEMDVSDANCGEDTITVEDVKDVNRTGEFTLLDLGIDAWYNGVNASDTDSTKYDADVVADGKIDDNDLAEITAQILGNSNYAPNSYQ